MTTHHSNFLIGTRLAYSYLMLQLEKAGSEKGSCNVFASLNEMFSTSELIHVGRHQQNGMDIDFNVQRLVEKLFSPPSSELPSYSQVLLKA